MKIRKSLETEKTDILNLHKKAFGEEKGPEIAKLVEDLFEDNTARPILSLVAVKDDVIVGHILYTKVIISGTNEELSSQILAPLAVLPEVQGQGIGGQLINQGLNELKKTGVRLVFVLGHVNYYPRYGFTPAGALGYEAPYHIPQEHAGAWMVQELFPGVIGQEKGKVQCSDVLNAPQHWRE